MRYEEELRKQHELGKSELMYDLVRKAIKRGKSKEEILVDYQCSEELYTEILAQFN